MIDLESYSIRAQILQALGERCQALAVLLPNNSEGAADVYWSRSILRPDELPAVVITPQPEAAQRSYGTDEMTMAVTISAVCLLGEHVAVDLGENLLTELRLQIGTTDNTLGGLAQDLRYVQGGVEDYPEEDDQALVVSATFEIDYATTANNPNEGA